MTELIRIALAVGIALVAVAVAVLMFSAYVVKRLNDQLKETNV